MTKKNVSEDQYRQTHSIIKNGDSLSIFEKSRKFNQDQKTQLDKDSPSESLRQAWPLMN